MQPIAAADARNDCAELLLQVQVAQAQTGYTRIGDEQSPRFELAHVEVQALGA